MFHRALWMRTFKQGKYVLLLFWLSSFYMLPYQYYNGAQSELSQSTMKFDGYVYYYAYSFQTVDPVMIQGITLIALACLLIGWERSNQSIDFLFSMPFKRKDIFLTKWLFGIFNIIIVNIVCWISMYGIKKLSFHDQYQIFSPFHTYFLYTTIILIAVYTFALFIGTITGSLLSQGFLTASILYLPYILIVSLLGFFYVHVGDSEKELYKTEPKFIDYIEQTSVLAPLHEFYIQYDYHPIENFDQHGNKISESPRLNPMEKISIPSAWNLLSTIAYIIIFFPLGITLYTYSPNDQNGKILLFPKSQKWFIACTVICIALLGGRILGMRLSIWGYYISVFGTGIISYIILTRLLKWKFSLGGR
ncbi:MULTISPECIES: ABC transporter permease subunit [unclassified Bacillus (in: firmicutes)]|uniref:ABC transporter permease subunit n=1 Tax=unclassified Bacillus (in: firmicutes) TaxID=185979 RepID=UPI0008E739B5|nr:MULTISPECIES: ABC transporter permease subunit [unclassified Bacillus (in: firmicutes)]SFI54306.1 ABC-2 family transporter protein [Bacillus sp. 71mf]SFS47287.1 ABC-2 family transporter protein [Bacillus sp. 103mf]